MARVPIASSRTPFKKAGDGSGKTDRKDLEMIELPPGLRLDLSQHDPVAAAVIDTGC